ncbi:MAG: large conductance mechanosensitive channel protein MscL [Spirochaetales bacterium]
MKKKKKTVLEKGVDNVGNFMQDFKKFAFKKNIMDLAVAVVVGGAFGKIVTSLVDDIITPLLSMLLGTVSFADLKIVITPATETVAEVAINYGSFLQSMIDFLIIAFFIFIAIKIINKGQAALEKAVDKIDGIEGNLKPAPQEAPLTKDQQLLTQIVELLEKQAPQKDEQKKQ